VNKTAELLAAPAPKLRKAVRDAVRAGYVYVVLDGTLIPVDRVAADRPFYSGKHRRDGMNLQVMASPDGGLLWVSGAGVRGATWFGARQEGQVDLGRPGRAAGRRDRLVASPPQPGHQRRPVRGLTDSTWHQHQYAHMSTSCIPVSSTPAGSPR
jgi:hypothetical protein